MTVSSQSRLGPVRRAELYCKDCVLVPQGIDLEAGGRNKKVRRTAPKSDNVYLKLLVKVTSVSSG